jgi:cytochrome b
MSTLSASPAEDRAVPGPATTAAPPVARVRIWDAPVRVFHWAAVLCFAGAWVTAETERWRLVHVTLGYTLAGLLAFRLVWGLVGTKHARFASFVRGPRAVGAYLRGLLRGEAVHTPGHNPAGALAIVGLLGLIAAVTASGWALYDGRWGEAFEDLHEGAANALMALVVVHVLAVVAGSLLHRENLVGAMVTGFKPVGAHVTPADGIRSAWRSVAVLMIVAMLGFWSWQWQGARNGGADARPAAAAASAEGGTAAGTRHRREHGD